MTDSSRNSSSNLPTTSQELFMSCLDVQVPLGAYNQLAASSLIPGSGHGDSLHVANDARDTATIDDFLAPFFPLYQSALATDFANAANAIPSQQHGYDQQQPHHNGGIYSKLQQQHHDHHHGSSSGGHHSLVKHENAAPPPAHQPVVTSSYAGVGTAGIFPAAYSLPTAAGNAGSAYYYPVNVGSASSVLSLGNGAANPMSPPYIPAASATSNMPNSNATAIGGGSGLDFGLSANAAGVNGGSVANAGGVNGLGCYAYYNGYYFAAAAAADAINNTPAGQLNQNQFAALGADGGRVGFGYPLSLSTQQPLQQDLFLHHAAAAAAKEDPHHDATQNRLTANSFSPNYYWPSLFAATIPQNAGNAHASSYDGQHGGLAGLAKQEAGGSGNFLSSQDPTQSELLLSLSRFPQLGGGGTASTAAASTHSLLGATQSAGSSGGSNAQNQKTEADHIDAILRSLGAVDRSRAGSSDTGSMLTYQEDVAIDKTIESVIMTVCGPSPQQLQQQQRQGKNKQIAAVAESVKGRQGVRGSGTSREHNGSSTSEQPPQPDAAALLQAEYQRVRNMVQVWMAEKLQFEIRALLTLERPFRCREVVREVRISELQRQILALQKKAAGAEAAVAGEFMLPDDVAAKESEGVKAQESVKLEEEETDDNGHLPDSIDFLTPQNGEDEAMLDEPVVTPPAVEVAEPAAEPCGVTQDELLEQIELLHVQNLVDYLVETVHLETTPCDDHGQSSENLISAAATIARYSPDAKSSPWVLKMDAFFKQLHADILIVQEMVDNGHASRSKAPLAREVIDHYKARITSVEAEIEKLMSCSGEEDPDVELSRRAAVSNAASAAIVQNLIDEISRDSSNRRISAAANESALTDPEPASEIDADVSISEQASSAIPDDAMSTSINNVSASFLSEEDDMADTSGFSLNDVHMKTEDDDEPSDANAASAVAVATTGAVGTTSASALDSVKLFDASCLTSEDEIQIGEILTNSINAVLPSIQNHAE